MDTERATLPALVAPLIGREDEMAALRRLLGRRASTGGRRLVTLTGPGGTGKSTLALALAAELASEFGGGARFVDLTTLSDPDLLLAAIAHAMRVTESGGEPLRDAVQRVLRQRPTLLVLDNFEHVLDAADQVAGLLAACQELSVLITSREPVGLRSESVFPVNPLGLPDLASRPGLATVASVPAVALFVDRAAARRHGFVLTTENYLSVAEICLRLDGLPLAIELAAAQVGVLSPQSVLRRLQDRAPFVVNGPRELPARHQTLRAVVDWSYELLSPPEQAVFRGCGVFAGSCTAAAIESVYPAQPAQTDVLGALVQLATKSLVLVVDDGRGEPRFRLLETIRTYAAEQLRQQGEWDLVRRRHADSYLALAERLQPSLRGPNLGATLDRLASEYDDFRLVFEWSAETGNIDVGLRLASALYRFWFVRGYLAEPRQWLDRALARSDRVAPEVRARALNAAGVLAGVQHDNARATELLEASVTLWTALGDLRNMATALANLGLVAHDQADLPRALELFQRAELAYRQADDRFGVANATGSQSRVAREQGDFELATRLAERSMALNRELGDDLGIAHSLANLGHTLLCVNDTARAGDCFSEALRLHLPLGNVVGVTECLEGVAAAVVDRKPRRAVQLLSAGQAFRQTVGGAAPRPEHDLREQTLARARARLSEQGFSSAWASGQVLTLEAAAAYALGADDTPSGVDISRPALTNDDPLSPREREVAQLIAQGRSNRDIAGALVLSTKTVERHVSNIFEKLGVQARSEVAVWAARHGLVPDAV